MTPGGREVDKINGQWVALFPGLSQLQFSFYFLYFFFFLSFFFLYTASNQKLELSKAWEWGWRSDLYPGISNPVFHTAGMGMKLRLMLAILCWYVLNYLWSDILLGTTTPRFGTTQPFDCSRSTSKNNCWQFFPVTDGYILVQFDAYLSIM